MRLAHELRNRMQILLPVQTPNTDGGLDKGYWRLGTVWAALSPAGGEFMNTLVQYIRDEQVSRVVTHRSKIRKSAVNGMSSRAFGLAFGPGIESYAGGFGSQYTKGFDVAFRSLPLLMPVSSEYYMFLENGSGASIGRLFRIRGAVDPQERGEYYRVDLEEIGSHGLLGTFGIPIPPAPVPEGAAIAAEVEGIFVGPIWDDSMVEWR